MKDFIEIVLEWNPSALAPTGFSDCIVGMAYRGDNMVYVLSRTKCIDHLINKEFMSGHDANEYFDFNIECAYMGEHTPFFIND